MGNGTPKVTFTRMLTKEVTDGVLGAQTQTVSVPFTINADDLIARQDFEVAQINEIARIASARSSVEIDRLLYADHSGDIPPPTTSQFVPPRRTSIDPTGGFPSWRTNRQEPDVYTHIDSAYERFLGIEPPMLRACAGYIYERGTGTLRSDTAFGQLAINPLDVTPVISRLFGIPIYVNTAVEPDHILWVPDNQTLYIPDLVILPLEERRPPSSRVPNIRG